MIKIRPFEIGLISIFVILGGLGLFLLATYSPSEDSDVEKITITQPVLIWGTLPSDGVQAVIATLIEENQSLRGLVQYRYFDPEQFDERLLNALADNEGPDLVLISHEKLADQRHRIQPLSYENFPRSSLVDTYVEGAQIFALSDGLYAWPVAVDPLMMYWNRDIVTSAGYFAPPSTWEELVNTTVPELIDRDFDRTINRSVVAMGEYSNIRNSFGILSMLIIQGGSNGVTEDRGNYIVSLHTSPTGDNPVQLAAEFYTRFSRPSNALYSWNRALSEDRRRFSSEDLVFYFGYASEGRQIERQNPNLNFDIAEVPQGAEAIRRTYGRFYGLAMLNSSDNLQNAGTVGQKLSNSAFATQIAVASNMAPVHQGVVAAGSNDTFGRMVYKSVPVTFGWLNPNMAAADEAFGLMTRDINENRSDVSRAAADTVGRLGGIYRR